MKRLAPVLALALVACGGTGRTRPTMTSARIVELRTGAELDADTFAARLVQARAIYVGERHDSAADHAAQAWVVALVGERDPSIAVGVEMVSRPYQDALDAWSRREIDDDALLVRTEWADRWGMDFAMYRPIFVAARDAGGRVVALNAPREWTRPIARTGIDSLDPAIRAALPELDTTNAEHRAMVTEALSGHGAHGGGEMDPAMLERFYLAQLVWDETMGETVARTLSAENAPHHLVVLAGRMHVQRGLGIPRCATRRMPDLTSIVVLPLTDEELRAEGGSPTPIADYALLVED